MAILISFTEVLPYIVLVLAVIGIGIFYVLWEKKRSKPTVDEAYLINIISALGEIDNIGEATVEHRRVQIELKMVDKVNIEQLKALDISAFLTGSKITLLVNEQGVHLLDHIKSKRKEER